MSVRNFYVADKPVERLYIGSRKVKELYYEDKLIFKGTIDLTNELSSMLRNNASIDNGFSEAYVYMPKSAKGDFSKVEKITVKPGHIYFIRGWTRNYGTYLWGGTNKIFLVTIDAAGNPTRTPVVVASGANTANAILWQAPATTGKPEDVTGICFQRYHTGQCPVGHSVISSSGLQMVVDVTDLIPEIGGSSAKALDVWKFIGGTEANYITGGQYNSDDLIGSSSPIFYGTKEFELP